MSNKRQNINKTIKTTITPRTDTSRVEIQKHFEIVNKLKYSRINPGIETLPIVGEIEEFKDPNPLNFTKPRVSSLDTKLGSQSSSYHELEIPGSSDCAFLNKKVEEINKQLADLEKDIQTNFYDPKTTIGSFVQNPNNTPISLSQISLGSNVFPKQKTSSIKLEIDIRRSKSKQDDNVFKNEPKIKTPKSANSDPSIVLKNEIMEYRQSIKTKLMDEKMERKIEELRNERMQSDEQLLPPNIAESLKKIQEMHQGSSQRLFPSELNLGSLSSRSNFHSQAISTQTSFIAEVPLSPSPKDIPEENKDDLEFIGSKLPNYELEPLKELDFVEDMLRSTQEELKNIKTDMNQFLTTLNEIENTDNYLPDKQEDKKRKSITSKSSSEQSTAVKQSKPKSVTSKTSSDRSVGVTQKKHIPIWERYTPRSAPSTARSDMSKKFKNKKEDTPSTPKPRSIKTTPRQINDEESDFDIPHTTEEKSIFSPQKEYILPPKISQDQPSTSKKEENNRKKDPEIFNKCDYCPQKQQPTPNSTLPLPIPPNTPEFTPDMDSPRNSEEKDIEPNRKLKHKLNISVTKSSKNKLSVQTLPAVDIRRPLVTQKLPDVIIKPTDTTTNKEKSPKYDNAKYEEVIHEDAKSPKEKSKCFEKLKCKKRTDTPQEEQPSVETEPKKNVKIDETPELIESPEQSEKSLSIREELNLNIDDVPSVRTLKEIQNYLENRCALIKKRLEEERELKPGEFMSLRWTLNQPPKWKQNETPSSQSSSEKITPENIKSIIKDKKKNTAKFSQSQHNIDTILKTWNERQTTKQNLSDKNKKMLKLKKTEVVTNTFAIESPSQELMKDEYTQIHQQEFVLQNRSTQYSLGTSETTSAEVVDQNLRPNIDSVDSKFNEFVRQQLKNKNESTQYSIQSISTNEIVRETEKDFSLYDKSTQYTSPKFIPEIDIPSSKTEECCVHGHTESQDCLECIAEKEKPSEIPEFVAVSSQTTPVHKYWKMGQDLPKAVINKYLQPNKEVPKILSIEEVPISVVTYSKYDDELINQSLECCPHGCSDIEVCSECQPKKEKGPEEEFFHIPDYATVSTQTSPIHKCDIIRKEVPGVPIPIKVPEQLETTASSVGNICKIVPDVPGPIKVPEQLETTGSCVGSLIIPDVPSSVKVPEKIILPTVSEASTQKDLTPRYKPCKVLHPVTVLTQQIPPQISDITVTSDKIPTFDECTQTSAEFCAAQIINIDDYRKSPQQPPRRVPSPVESSSESFCRPNKVKFKHPQRHKTCSTPYTSTSSSTTEKCSSISPFSSDKISLSDGEVKLPCECSTSIGEIHICHFANKIRKRVRRLKQNEELIAKENTDTSRSAYVSHKYKYNDNWVTYYITKDKTLSSGEIVSENNVTSLTVSSSD